MNFKCWGHVPLVMLIAMGCSDDTTTDDNVGNGGTSAAGAGCYAQANEPLAAARMFSGNNRGHYSPQPIRQRRR